MVRFSPFIVYVVAAVLFLTSEPLTLGQRPGFAAGDPPPKSEKKSEVESLRAELLKMGEQDQLHRTELQAKTIEMSKAGTTAPSEALLVLQKKQDEIDKRNLERLEQIIMLHGWPGKSLVGEEAGQAAFLILQHADLTSQKKHFPLLKQAAAQNELRLAEMAMLEDRILMREGKKQIYGTQLHSGPVTNGKLELYPIEDEEHVDEHRASVKLPPLADYLKLFGMEYKPKSKK